MFKTADLICRYLRVKNTTDTIDMFAVCLNDDRILRVTLTGESVLTDESISVLFPGREGLIKLIYSGPKSNVALFDNGDNARDFIQMWNCQKHYHDG